MHEAALSLSPLPGDGVWMELTRRSVPIASAGARAYAVRRGVFCARSRPARHAQRHPRVCKVCPVCCAAFNVAERRGGLRRKQIDGTRYPGANEADGTATRFLVMSHQLRSRHTLLPPTNPSCFYFSASDIALKLVWFFFFFSLSIFL